MTLPGALVFSVVAVGLSAALLASASTRQRLAGEQHRALEAEFAMQTALANSRLAHERDISTIAPGTIFSLPGTPSGAWLTSGTIERLPASPLVLLRVRVQSLSDNPLNLVARSGGLLLRQGPADTAYVISSRPGF